MLPRSSDRPLASEADHAINKEAIRGGSKSFYSASWLLPESVRRPAFGLYAFCRLADDAVDEVEAKKAAVERLRQRLTRIYAGDPEDHPADRAFSDVVRDYYIPPEVPFALIDGFAWDSEGRMPATFSELRAYSARVASTVGVMMTLLMRVRDPAALARACDLGVAMQLTNIARDVGEDARAGRLYLPLDWLAEAGVDPEAFLAKPEPSPALKSVVARLLAEADALYERSREGVARLPLACRPAILSAALIYCEIGREVERRGHDSVTTRAYVGHRRKLALLAEASARAIAPQPVLEAPPLPETAFLVEAVEREPAPDFAPVNLRTRALRVLEMFERLERMDRAEQMVR
ncbi:phytoene synthase [Rhodoblastus acidophilus]|uniref:phytoene/squalene synthase family protein n=1 Tax=Rhodoblastus acidophilus TaxID=1074 RepID=UPI0022251330|nr:phytoene/squalene synthase family protein [Rhodoblastus acidophilus]MCW2282311.1 phytoene synthase [Rhodoblastus acidophilus]MCW2331284.1 phytoene synthase [Rhodoblastus acidophilus]